jgi:hypothetical protein
MEGQFRRNGIVVQGALMDELLLYWVVLVIRFDRAAAFIIALVCLNKSIN